MTDICDPSPTHDSVAGGVSFKFDRAFSSFPAWAVDGVIARAPTLEDFAGLRRRTLRPHSGGDAAHVQAHAAGGRPTDCACGHPRPQVPAAPSGDVGALGVQHAGSDRADVGVPARGTQHREGHAGCAHRGELRGAQSAVVVAVARAVAMPRPREARLLLEHWMRMEGGRVEVIDANVFADLVRR